MTTKADTLVDQGADRLQQLADRTAGDTGVKAKLADALADDAAFLRKLKPSLIVARVRGEAPTNQKPGSGPVAPPAPPPAPKRRRRSGPNPLLVVAAAFAAGVLVAKLLDWRGHAHPRD
jgi:hypothetical protein